MWSRLAKSGCDETGTLTANKPKVVRIEARYTIFQNRIVEFGRRHRSSCRPSAGKAVVDHATKTPVHVAVDGQLAGVILSPILCARAREALAKLKKRGSSAS